MFVKSVAVLELLSPFVDLTSEEIYLQLDISKTLMLNEEWKMTMKFHILLESLCNCLYRYLYLRAVQISLFMFFTRLCDFYAADVFIPPFALHSAAPFGFALTKPTYLLLSGLLIWHVSEDDV